MRSRYPWVTTKRLSIIFGHFAVGALVLDEGLDTMLSGRGTADGKLIAGAAYDVAALDVARMTPDMTGPTIQPVFSVNRI